MKRLTTLIVATLMVVGIATLGLGIAQAAFLKVDIAAPDGSINSRTFNIEYTTLSTDQSANISVSLLQNGSVIRTDTTTKPYGDSGDFEITVPTDGTYTYQFKATSGTDSAVSQVKTVKVDTVPTSVPAYGGVERDGNTYTVTFTAPANGDVRQIRIYSSANPTFTADGSTQVAVVDVEPGETVRISFTAPDDRQRYTVVQAFDSAGNGSRLIGDPNTNVTQGLGNAGQALGVAGAAALGVAAADDNADAENEDGNVDADGESRDDREVEGEQDQAKQEDSQETSDDSWIAWVIIGAIVLGAIAYINRERIQAFIKRDK